ncbi:MAG: hypothetical protein H0V69_11385 [Acidimicrobiia bacterium]|nr:hypothetical protein [Acidimicrobiia bacterium]
MRTARVLLLAATLAVTACSDDDNAQPSSSSSDPSSDSAYAVLTEDAWTLQDAVDPPADAPIVSVEQPPLEWDAEYVRSSASEFAMVRLSGHHATFNDTRSTLEGLGFTLDDVPLTQWHRAGGSADADPASPTIILLDNGPITLMVLSYDLDLDQLTTIADTVEGVDQPAWIAAGGVVR